MMLACATSKRWEEAISIMHTSADIVKGGAAELALLFTQALSYAILACSKSDQWEEAIKLLSLYGNQSSLSWLSSPTTTSCSSLSLEKEKNKNTTATLATVTCSALNSLITSCGRRGHPDLALKILNEMESKYGVQLGHISYRSAAIACNRAEHNNNNNSNIKHRCPAPLPYPNNNKKVVDNYDDGISSIKTNNNNDSNTTSSLSPLLLQW